MEPGDVKIYFVIGVCGVGKSTIGMLLGQKLKIPFFDGDDYHGPENIKKMSKGVPLKDEDRVPWLNSLNQLAKKEVEGEGCVIACSALRENYRANLAAGIEEHVKWIFLKGTYNQVNRRLITRKDHFMTAEMLQSQIDSLEEPSEAITIDIKFTPHEIIKMIENKMSTKPEFGLLGLGVMGKSLSRNLAQKGFKLSIFNRHVDDLEVNVAADFKKEYDELDESLAFDDLEAFVDAIQRPRKIMLMVNAGKTTDVVIKELLPFLSEGDILIDGGNSHYEDTKQRYHELKSRGVHFIGAGVSGGEEGALTGPSIMPGGELEAYEMVKEYLEAIAARDTSDLPCCTYIGSEGSGHFVKMVHNGIEYAEMQLLAEVTSIMSHQGNSCDEIADTLETWKSSSSYLLEITVDIFKKKEGDDWLLNKILDKAGNKGTGNWATVSTAQLGVPSTMITGALFTRYLSFFKEERKKAQDIYASTRKEKITASHEMLLEAYHFARIVNHHQGFKFIAEASITNAWNLNVSEIARIWTNGCIIRSGLMEELVNVLMTDENILQSESIARQLRKNKPSISSVVSQCVLAGVPIPSLSEAINFFNGYKTANSSANVIQAQRDYFGAHTYQRVDDETGKFYHTEWK